MTFFIVTEDEFAKVKTRECSNGVSDVEIEVQIMGMKDTYNKKTKKTPKGSENRLEDSEVTVVMQASDEITCVRAYIQRCPEAAIRTHDTIGKNLQAYLSFIYGLLVFLTMINNTHCASNERGVLVELLYTE